MKLIFCGNVDTKILLIIFVVSIMDIRTKNLHRYLGYVTKTALQRYSYKRYSEKIQQIYRKTPMSKYDFNKVAKQFYWNHNSAWVFCKFAAYFQNTFSKVYIWRAASVLIWSFCVFLDILFDCFFNSNSRLIFKVLTLSDIFL